MNFYGILAYPASHSLSPLLHNAVFSHYKLESAYHRYEISPENLASFINNWKTDIHKKGLSVSVPHKESIISYTDELTESARIIGAVNTVYKSNTNNKISIGDNTDWIGFSKSLEENYNPKNKTVLVLGAGGATKAIIYSLIKLDVSKIYIWNRTKSKADELVVQFNNQFDNKVGNTCHSIENPLEIKEQIDLVVNTTSLGMKGKLETLSPIDSSFWLPKHTAYDIVYTPKNTVFLSDCKNAGGISLSGDDMLLYQAIEQSKIFTFNSPPDKGEKVNCEAREPDLGHLGGCIHSNDILRIMKNTLKNNSQSNTQPWEKKVLTENQKNNILETIVRNKQTEIYESYEFWKKENIEKGDHSFKKALQNNMSNKNTPRLIAEIKPASPSRGSIFRTDDTVESIAKLYSENNVSCISVLTDFTFFGASIENITKAKQNSPLPLLRKDFIIHPSQIYEARAFRADAVLLMRSVLNAVQIQEFLELCKTLKMDALVEVHDERELIDILENTTAEIIGVNNRNLKTLQIDKNTFNTLYKKYHSHVNRDILWVCESGISSKEDIEKYAIGADAILVGTGILTAENREEKLKELTGKKNT